MIKFLLINLLITFFSGVIWAEKPSIVILAEGQMAQQLQNEAAAVVPSDYKQISDNSLRANLETNSGLDIASLQKAAKKLKLTGLLLLKSKPTKRGLRVRVLMFDTVRDKQVYQADVILTATGKRRREEFDFRPLGSNFENAFTNLNRSLKEQEISAPPNGENASESTESWLVLHLGFELGGRNFSYNQPLSNNLRPYEVVGASLVGLGAEFFPMRITNAGGFLTGVGFNIDFSRSFGLDSSVEGDEQTFSTNWSHLVFGLQWHVITNDTIDAAFVLGYGAETFAFKFTRNLSESDQAPSASALITEVPEVDYRFVHLGITSRIKFSQVHAIAGFHYRHLLQTGRVGDVYFPNSTAGAVDGHLGLAMALPFINNFETRLVLNYSRSFYDLRPKPGDAYVAGGALDQLVRLHFGVAYYL